MKNRILRQHNLIWIIITVLFILSPIDYSIKFSTIITLLFYLIIANISFLLGSSNAKTKKQTSSIDIKNITIFFYLITVFSSIYFICTYLKIVDLTRLFEFDISLSGFTKLRIDQMTSNHEMGSNVFGIIASITGGWPLISIPFYLNYKLLLNKNRKKITLIIILIYALSTLTTGGRNGIIIIILVYILSKFLIEKKLYLNFKYFLFSIIVMVLIVIIFSTIFIERAISTTGDLNSYIMYIELSYEQDFKPYAKYLLNNYLHIYFPFLLFHEYIVHSFYEFEKILLYSHNSALYLGQYNFYFITIFLNKLGFSFITIDQILNVIPNPGRYLTLFGMLIIDYGRYFSIVIIIIIYYYAGYNISIYKLRYSFGNLLLAIYFSGIIIMSPIFNLIGTSVYPSFLFAIITYLFMIKTKLIR